MIDLPDKQLFRIDEAAMHLDVSKSTIYRFIDHGKLKAVKIGDKLIRIPRESLLDLLKIIE